MVLFRHEILFAEMNLIKIGDSRSLHKVPDILRWCGFTDFAFHREKRLFIFSGLPA